MPESKVRKDAATKRKVDDRRQLAEKRPDRERHTPRGTRSTAWVPWAFCILGLLGVAWLVTFYVAGQLIPGMRELGNWNILVGMGLIGAAFCIATLWK